MNPWRKGEWTGDWSDGHELWDTLPKKWDNTFAEDAFVDPEDEEEFKEKHK